MKRWEVNNRQSRGLKEQGMKTMSSYIEGLSESESPGNSMITSLSSKTMTWPSAVRTKRTSLRQAKDVSSSDAVLDSLPASSSRRRMETSQTKSAMA